MANNAKQAKKPLAAARWEKLRRRLGWMTLLALLALTGGGALLFRYGDLPAGATMQSTRIVDANGQLLASLQGGVNRQIVKLSDISPWLVKATLAVEDRRFYEHAGVDLRGLARAAWVDMRHMSKEQGASTLTQQLARNLYLSHERTWTRKLKEAWYAAKLEQRYSKDEILELYLNQIYYGHGAYGAEAAARLYFNKPAKQLDVAESAMLAGIPKGPRYYSPHLHPDDAKIRQRKVLQAMQETGQLSKEHAAKAASQVLKVRPLPEEEERAAPYFADYVKKVAIEQIGIDERLMNEGGLTIHTTLDVEIQRKAEAAVKKGLQGGNSELQTALIALDPRNGYIKAMVGGRNYRNNQYNRVFAGTRQPGSSFKPILYASALEQHAVTPATRFRSEPTLFYFDHDRQIYRPSNYNGRYFHGEIGMRQAIAASDNIYAVNTIMRVGPEAVISMARKLGVTSTLKAVPSLALGTFPVSPFEMASAFTVFANEGRRANPIAITSIRDRDGEVLYESRVREEQVITPALAFVTTQLLESVFDRGGTAHRVAKMLKRPVAGKTGTTDSDAWFVGYTPELTTAVWVGYDRGRAITSSEAHRAAPIFAQFTETALGGTPPRIFPMPEGVVRVYVDPATNLLASPTCPGQAVLETFLAGTEPTEACADLGGVDGERAGKGGEGRSIWSKFRRWVGV
ncbi:transglycosylase domain-containing protein [Cohnella cholangitidis]|uniref:PBP1A family penicillin-binding protein n=1 Tax=Cohnella cholangitidis TaxID=2598458 RepID=A0A7G5C025_9BACL|nr:PBP1A family penicillin-binding protein [Cohnella cholangitidis]QMV42559.1 PBP1A family penicillin-binding protein [Cohnella cholangitidis]